MGPFARGQRPMGPPPKALCRPKFLAWASLDSPCEDLGQPETLAKAPGHGTSPPRGTVGQGPGLLCIRPYKGLGYKGCGAITPNIQGNCYPGYSGLLTVTPEFQGHRSLEYPGYR